MQNFKMKKNMSITSSTTASGDREVPSTDIVLEVDYAWLPSQGEMAL